MRYLFSILLVLFALSSNAVAQTQPTPQPAQQQLTQQRDEKWRGRPLPPSMQAELKQLRAKQGSRAIVFRDTVRASQIARQVFNDSDAVFDTSMVFEDSALTVVDSGVSLTHKEWLDSLIVEIPEVSRSSERIDFNYPQTIMTEPVKRGITIPSINTSLINPIQKENLPYFDQSPIPLTLSQGHKTSGYLSAGGGNIHLPLARAGLSHTLSPRLAFDINGIFQAFGEASALRSHYNATILAKSELGFESALEAYRATVLEIKMNTSGKTTDLITATDSNGEHSLQDLLFGLRLNGNIAQPLYFDLLGEFGSFSEEDSITDRESRYEALLHFTYDFGTDFRVRGDLTISGAGEVSGATQDETAPLSLLSVRGLVGQRSWGSIEWYGGVRLVSVSDLDGNRSHLLPQGLVRIPLNPRWEFGGSYEPNAAVITNYHLGKINAFYSPRLTVAMLDSAMIDPRRVMVDRINVGGFMNYMLSADDQIRTEVRYIERNDEPVFVEHEFDDERGSFFSVAPAKTRRLIVSGNANFLLFKRDVVTAGLEFRSATDRETEEALSFEPLLKFTGAYSFNSIAPYLRPVAEFQYLSRTDHAMAFINVGTEILFSERLTATVRVDNLFNSVGDFWSGYNERPRAILGAVTYKF